MDTRRDNEVVRRTTKKDRARKKRIRGENWCERRLGRIEGQE